MPVIKNVKVAANERLDNLPNPQTPCPLVQPLPFRTPNPTSNPAIDANGRFLFTSGGMGISRAMWAKLPPASKPKANSHRQALSI